MSGTASTNATGPFLIAWWLPPGRLTGTRQPVGILSGDQVMSHAEKRPGLPRDKRHIGRLANPTRMMILRKTFAAIRVVSLLLTGSIDGRIRSDRFGSTG